MTLSLSASLSRFYIAISSTTNAWKTGFSHMGDSLTFMYSKSTNIKSVLAFGNPLLDVTVSSKQLVKELLQKYNLKSDGQQEFSREKMLHLTNDIQGEDLHLSPGGCCQNSLRVMQWILHKKGVASIFGSVGSDVEADILKQALEIDGVTTRYIKQPNFPTGKSIALVDDVYRSLVAYIGAAEILPLQSLLSYPDFSSIFQSNDIIFIEAFFLTNRSETAQHIVDLCKATGKLLVFNLCGEYIFDIVPEDIRFVVKHSHVVFGNLNEFNELRKLLGYQSIHLMAEHLITQGTSTLKHPKVLVITNGSEPVKCFYEDPVVVKTFQAPKLQGSEITDTIGAGDAFTGGFLAGLSLSKSVSECMNIAFYSAKNIIKQRGCTIPKYESIILTDNDLTLSY